MKRVLALSAVLLVSSSVLADEANVAKHETEIKNMIKVLGNFADALESVKDKDTAKAAAPKLEKVAKDMEDIKKRVDALTKLSKEEDEKLQKKYMPELEKVQKRLFEVAQKAGLASGGEPTFLAALEKIQKAAEKLQKP